MHCAHLLHLPGAAARFQALHAAAIVLPCTCAGGAGEDRGCFTLPWPTASSVCSAVVLGAPGSACSISPSSRDPPSPPLAAPQPSEPPGTYISSQCRTWALRASNAGLWASNGMMCSIPC